LIDLFGLEGGEQVGWVDREAAVSVFFAESMPAWMARQMSTLLVPVRSTAPAGSKLSSQPVP
jgi:hypothetical protein